MNSSLPRIASLREKCCGCGACSAKCPKSCIAMKADACGFDQPSIDTVACVGCGGCDTVCPALNGCDKDVPEKVLWAKSSNTEERFFSSSGGIFALLAHRTLDAKGIVIGAAWETGCKELHHRIVDHVEKLDSIMRSKYVQSTIDREIYAGVRNALREGCHVLFSGTACQVAGMRNYLGKLAESEYFLAVDVICHGVPSPKLWRRWASHKEEVRNATLRAVNLRSKATGWSSYSSVYDYTEECDGRIRADSCVFRNDWYMKTFLENTSLRPSCFSCPAKRSSGSDITLGDFWGICSVHPDVKYEDGVSAVLCNTSRGAFAVEAIEPSMEYGKSAIEKVLLGNPCLEQSVSKSKSYEAFMSALADDLSIEQMMKQWNFESTFLQRVRSKLCGIGHRAKRQLGK